MPIQPFKDTGRFQFKQHPNSATPKSGSIASPSIDQFRQGVSLRNSLDVYGKRLIPFLGSHSLPENIFEPIDFSLDRTSYGDVQLFDISENEMTTTPFYDIASLSDPVAFLKDDGITAYPQIMLSPNWTDPGMMNGIIEPLTVRGVLPGFNIDTPFVAKSIKASLQESPVQYIEKNPEMGLDKDPPFQDSQDSAMSGESIIISAPGIGDFGKKSISPYDESGSKTIRNDLMNMDSSTFEDDSRMGINSVSISSNFNYTPKKVVQLGSSGYRNKTVIDSIAFGGLIK